MILAGPECEDCGRFTTVDIFSPGCVIISDEIRNLITYDR
jgi:hypothetical protein